MSGYDYPAFLAAVQRQRRTAPTGCFYCDVVLETTCGPAATRSMQALCAKVSGFVVDAHHVVPKQVLKREHFGGALEARSRELDDLLMDARNGVLLRRYHHDLVEARSVAIPKLLLPEETLAFAVELGLDWYLDKMDDRRT